GGDVLFRERVQDTQVDREAGDGRLRDALTTIRGHCTARHAPTLLRDRPVAVRAAQSPPVFGSTVRSCERLHKVKATGYRSKWPAQPVKGRSRDGQLSGSARHEGGSR